MEIWKQAIYFVFQSAFMTEKDKTLDTLQDIRKIMDRSSRFISLSGWSGVAAGLCALAGAWAAHDVIQKGIQSGHSLRKIYHRSSADGINLSDYMGSRLFFIACITFTAALVFAFLFTWLRSKKTGTPLFGSVSRRLTLAVGIPLLTGGIYVIHLMQAGAFGFIAPGTMLFYGLGLVNASRYTSVEIKYLGYSLLLIAMINLLFMGYGLYFWALGFGLLHIIYGVFMWYRYERPGAEPN